MSPENKISVVIPIYNVAPYIEKCLLSLATQTYKNIEFLLVNDGSTDDSEKICLRYSSQDERFKYIYQENSGVSAARNLALQNVTGDFIGFCDADDYVEPDYYETLFNLINEFKADIAVCGFLVERNGNAIRREGTEEKIAVSAETAAKKMYDAQYGGYCWNKLIRRSAFSNISFPNDIVMFEDMYFYINLCLTANIVAFWNVQKYHYVRREHSALSAITGEAYYTGSNATRRIFNLIKKNFPKLIPYAQESVIGVHLSIAIGLAQSGKLNRKAYKELKDIIKPQVNKQSLKLFSRKRQLGIKLFLMGRVLFELVVKIIY